VAAVAGGVATEGVAVCSVTGVMGERWWHVATGVAPALGYAGVSLGAHCGWRLE